MNYQYELKDWALVVQPKDAYDPPELWKHKAQGKVFGRKDRVDGSDVITSTIQDLKTLDNGDMIALTQNSSYLLKKDTINEDYQKYLEENSTNDSNPS